MRWTFASPSAIDAVAQRPSFIAYLRARCGPEEDYGAAEIVYGELIGNVIRHANGPIRIDLELDDGVAVLRVGDRGPGFQYAGCLMGGQHDEGGRGMFLVAAFADDVRIEPNAGGGACVSVRLRVRCSRPRVAH